MRTLLVIGGSGFFGKSILDAFARGLLKPLNITHVIVMARNAQRLIKEAPEFILQKCQNILYLAEIKARVRHLGGQG